MADNLKADLADNALLMAIWQRKPSKGLVWYTDRGSQYCTPIVICKLSSNTLLFKTREEARLAIFEYIEVFYNRVRMHSANDYLPPNAFENLRYTA